MEQCSRRRSPRRRGLFGVQNRPERLLHLPCRPAVNRGSTQTSTDVEVGPRSHEGLVRVSRRTSLKACSSHRWCRGCGCARETDDISLGLSAQFLGPGPAVIRVAREEISRSAVSRCAQSLLIRSGTSCTESSTKITNSLSIPDAIFPMSMPASATSSATTDIEISGCLPRRFHDRSTRGERRSATHDHSKVGPTSYARATAGAIHRPRSLTDSRCRGSRRQRGGRRNHLYGLLRPRPDQNCASLG